MYTGPAMDTGTPSGTGVVDLSDEFFSKSFVLMYFKTSIMHTNVLVFF